MSALANTRQEKFCMSYVVCGNATKAAEEAEYSKRALSVIGSKLLRNAKVCARIDELMAEIKSKKIADAIEVQEFLTAAIRDEVFEDVVVVEEFNARVIRKRLSGRERVKAAELMAKRFGLLTDKLDVTGPITLVMKDDYGDDG